MPHDLLLSDPRSLLARPDLAEQALEGLVAARAYRATEPMRAAAGMADVVDRDGVRISQLLHGEVFDALDKAGDRLWGRCRRDGVVGWISASDLAPGEIVPTHRVASGGGPLPFNALVDPARDGVGDVALMPIGQFEPDLTAAALKLLRAPHRLGGRSDRGTDCAGLVQGALIACGLAAPRHADGQTELGRRVSRDDLGRSDLIVWLHPEGGPGWTGHSALAVDGDMIVHASGHAGSVVIEALETVDSRLRTEGFDAPQFRRVA